MNTQIVNSALQWVGAVFISLGHVLNSAGVAYHQDFWNILAFGVGTLSFLVWSFRVTNRPQTLVNVIGLSAIAVGLLRAV